MRQLGFRLALGFCLCFCIWEQLTTHANHKGKHAKQSKGADKPSVMVRLWCMLMVRLRLKVAGKFMVRVRIVVKVMVRGKCILMVTGRIVVPVIFGLRVIVMGPVMVRVEGLECESCLLSTVF